MRRQTALAVRLRPGANDALDPRDQIDVRQAQLPLGIALEVYDAHGLADAGTWQLVGAGGGADTGAYGGATAEQIADTQRARIAGLAAVGAAARAPAAILT